MLCENQERLRERQKIKRKSEWPKPRTVKKNKINNNNAGKEKLSEKTRETARVRKRQRKKRVNESAENRGESPVEFNF